MDARDILKAIIKHEESYHSSEDDSYYYYYMDEAGRLKKEEEKAKKPRIPLISVYGDESKRTFVYEDPQVGKETKSQEEGREGEVGDESREEEIV